MKNPKKSATIVALIIALVVAFVLVSCSSTSHVIVGKTRPPILPADVKVYMKPPARYEEIALLESSSKYSWSITDQGKTDKKVSRKKRHFKGDAAVFPLPDGAAAGKKVFNFKIRKPVRGLLFLVGTDEQHKPPGIEQLGRIFVVSREL